MCIKEQLCLNSMDSKLTTSQFHQALEEKSRKSLEFSVGPWPMSSSATKCWAWRRRIRDNIFKTKREREDTKIKVFLVHLDGIVEANWVTAERKTNHERFLLLFICFPMEAMELLHGHVEGMFVPVEGFYRLILYLAVLWVGKLTSFATLDSYFHGITIVDELRQARSHATISHLCDRLPRSRHQETLPVHQD